VPLQDAAPRRPLEPQALHRLRLLLVRAYIEFSLDDELLSAALSGTRQRDQTGIFASSGAVHGGDIAPTPMAAPEHHY